MVSRVFKSMKVRAVGTINRIQTKIRRSFIDFGQCFNSLTSQMIFDCEGGSFARHMTAGKMNEKLHLGLCDKAASFHLKHEIG